MKLKLSASCAIGVSIALSVPSDAASGQCGNMHVAQPLLDLLVPGTETSTAVASGAWSDPATWGGFTVLDLPQPGEDVRISEGVEVVFDVFDDGDGVGADSTRFGTVRVDGILRWAVDRETRVYLDTLLSSPGGEISIGTDAQPVQASVSADIVIIADRAFDFINDPRQLGRGFIPHGPHSLVGADKTDFAPLVGDALTGATALELREAPVGWEVGDTLVLGGTWFDPNGSNADNSRFHDEVLTITSIDGATIGIANTAAGSAGLRWDHVRPDGVHFNPDDLNIYVANLTRNITFRSELDPRSPDAPPPGAIRDMRRGHQMTMHTPESIIRNTAFYEFGRLNKNHFIDDAGTNVDGTPGQGLNVRGRYAVHGHRNLPQNNQPIDLAVCPPAEITGCVVWGSPGWGFVQHDGHALFRDNVAFDVLGSAFAQEAGNEIGLWKNNISIKTTGDDDPDLTVEPFGDGYKRVTNFDFGFNGEAYWVQGASQVEQVGNIAISAAGGGMDVFSDVDGNANRDRGVVPREHLPADRQYIVTSGDTIAGNRVPTRDIRGFEVINSDFGMLSWNHMRNQSEWIGFTCPCDGNVHREFGIVEGFKFWNIYGQGVHLQYSSQLEFRNGLIASADLATPGIDDKPSVDLSINGDGRGYGFGMNGPTKRLVLDNVIVEGWRFGIRTPLEGQINRFDLGDGTGSEGAMGLPLRRSAFRNLRLANNTNHFYRRQNGFTQTQPPANFLAIEGGSFSAAPANEPPTADFAWETVGVMGAVRLNGLPSRDADTPGDGLLPNNLASVFVDDSNYIVAYAWDIGADGSFEHFGETTTVGLTLGAATPIALTVWDHQGATDTITQTVSPGREVDPEAIVDGSFDGSFEGGIYGLTSAGASTGWWDARAMISGGGAELRGQFNFSSIAQAIYDDFARRGRQRLTFDFEMRDAPGTRTSTVEVKVFGINGEFGSDHAGAYPEPEGSIPVEITPLFSEVFSGPVGATTIERTIDFGSDGFQYVYVGFAGDGLDLGTPGDVAYVDNVSLVGAPLCVADLAHPSNVLDLADVDAFASAFIAGNALADFVAPFGVTDLSDVDAFIGSYLAGCP
ncbi:MAG: GC-type dockerin domain-anchored protein [Planctomycetota bacterium]